MLGKLNDNIAALVLGIYLLGIIMYVVQLIFMTEIWLKGEEVDVSAVTVARVLGINQFSSERHYVAYSNLTIIN